MSTLLSVSEYAKLHQKDCGNIRKMLASGRLQGHKIGHQWVIDADMPYPADQREKSGIYKNQRRKSALRRNRELMQTLDHMIPSLCKIYGKSLRQVILYGSYARGTQTDESDIDIALMLADKPTKQMTDAMVDCVADCELSLGKILSVIDIDLNMFHHWCDTLPFYRNISKEGIVLWHTAK